MSLWKSIYKSPRGLILLTTNGKWLINSFFTICLNIQYSTVADVVYVPYIADAKNVGIDIEQFPALVSWRKKMFLRPAVTAGFSIAKRGAGQIM